MKKMSMIAALPLMLGAYGPARAQPADAPTVVPVSDTEETSFAIIIYGDDVCPQGEGDEIVVCARHPESERYRIPKRIREKSPSSGGRGWADQAATMEETQREALPSGCSVVSSSGIGCFIKAMQQWRAERRQVQSENEP